MLEGTREEGTDRGKEGREGLSKAGRETSREVSWARMHVGRIAPPSANIFYPVDKCKKNGMHVAWIALSAIPKRG